MKIFSVLMMGMIFLLFYAVDPVFARGGSHGGSSRSGSHGTGSRSGSRGDSYHGGGHHSGGSHGSGYRGHDYSGRSHGSEYHGHGRRSGGSRGDGHHGHGGYRGYHDGGHHHHDYDYDYDWWPWAAAGLGVGAIIAEDAIIYRDPPQRIVAVPQRICPPQPPPCCRNPYDDVPVVGLPPGHARVWIPGHYLKGGGNRYVYVPGHWGN